MSDGVAMRKLGYTGASHYFSLPQHPFTLPETVAASSGYYFLDASKCVKASKVDGVHLDPSAHRILAMEIKKIVVSVLQKDKQKARERRR